MLDEFSDLNTEKEVKQVSKDEYSRYAKQSIEVIQESLGRHRKGHYSNLGSVGRKSTKVDSSPVQKAELLTYEKKDSANRQSSVP